MWNVSSLVHGLPAGTTATLRDMELTIGDMRVDLRTLLHECDAIDRVKLHTFPPDHAQYPRWTVALATRHGTYTGLVRHANGSYTATVPGKVSLTTHPTAGEAAIARAVYMNGNRNKRKTPDDDGFALAPPPAAAPSSLVKNAKNRLLYLHEELVELRKARDGGAIDRRASTSAEETKEEEEDVFFVKERTREERDAEGRAKAVEI